MMELKPIKMVRKLMRLKANYVNYGEGVRNLNMYKVLM
jgi:hypothetical protein